jgi:hypothetical protein
VVSAPGNCLPLSALGGAFPDLCSGRPHAFRRAERGGRAPDPRPWAELRQGAAGGEPGRDQRACAGEEPGFGAGGRRACVAPQPLFRADLGKGKVIGTGSRAGSPASRPWPVRDALKPGGRQAFRSPQLWTLDLGLRVRRFAPRQAIVTLQGGDRLRASSPAEAGDRARSRREAAPKNRASGSKATLLKSSGSALDRLQNL